MPEVAVVDPSFETEPSALMRLSGSLYLYVGSVWFSFTTHSPPIQLFSLPLSLSLSLLHVHMQPQIHLLYFFNVEKTMP